MKSSGLKMSLAAALMAVAMSAAWAQAPVKWEEGKHYKVLKPAVKMPAGKIDVTEVFWYACPHCAALEPYLQKWEASKASYIQLTRLPATWETWHKLHARLYYSLVALQRTDLHLTAFQEANDEKKGNFLLGDDIDSTERVHIDFARRHGIDPARFKAAYNSDEVLDQVKAVDPLMRRYKVDSVPFVIINGKYTTDIGMAGGHSQLIALIDELTARERGSR